MEVAALPPVRVQAHASSPLSLKAAQSNVDQFLSDFQSRSVPSKGGDTTITAQLHKLSKSLKEQRARERQNRGTRWYFSLLCSSLHTFFLTWIQIFDSGWHVRGEKWLGIIHRIIVVSRNHIRLNHLHNQESRNNYQLNYPT